MPNWFYLVEFPLFLLFQLPVAVTAWLVMRQMAVRNGFELLAGWGILYSAETIGLTFVLGCCGRLNPVSALLASVTVAVVVELICRRRGKAPTCSRWMPLDILLLSAGVVFIGVNVGLNLELPVAGTDALLYHLYYPSMWLHDGAISRIPIPGLPCDYYPIYGELFYGWLMMPFYHDLVAKNLQYLALLLAFFTVVAAAAGLSLPRRPALAAALAMVFTGVISRNAQVPNTDLLTGYFLLAGVTAFLLGQRRNSLAWLGLSGVAFGLCAGTKYLGLVTAAPMLLLLLAGWGWRRPAVRPYWWLPALTALIVASPYYLFNWYETGNPFFPVLIHIGNWTLWPHGIGGEHHLPVGLGGQTWHYYVNGDINGVSPEAAILALAVPVLLLLLLWRKRFFSSAGMRCSMGMLILLPVVTCLLQLRFYPAETQARQIIPVLMAGSLLLIPFWHGVWCRGWRYRRVVAVGMVLLAVAAGWRQNLPLVWAGVIVGTGFLYALIHFWPRFSRDARRALMILLPLLVIVGVGLQAIRAEKRKYANAAAVFPREQVHAMDMMEEATWRQPAVIAYCGGAGYEFMGNRYRNRVTYVPVTASGAEYAHQYPGWTLMRYPTDWKVWYARLQARQVRYLICDYSTFPVAFNAKLEAYWAATHPEVFQPLLTTKKMLVFAVKDNGR